MSLVNLPDLLSQLSNVRPLFHSEADFQLALGWQVRTACPSARVRLELPVPGWPSAARLDVLVHAGGEAVALELKYRKARLDVVHDDEQFHLRNQSARDHGRYDFLKDVCRLQVISPVMPCRRYAVLLTNDSGYWLKRHGWEDTQDAAFRLHEARELTGALQWSARAGPGVVGGRERPLVLTNTYQCLWRPYSEPAPGAINGAFRYLLVEVPPSDPAAHAESQR